MTSTESKAAWEATQKKTFTKWLNNSLKKKGYPQLNQLEEEFTDGVNLMHIVNALYDLPIPKYNKNPKNLAMRLDNCSVALKMVDDAKIKTNFLKTNHLTDKDLKMILGMAWAIILDYAIKGINVDDMTAKDGLLIWCKKKTAGYKGVDPPSISGFTTDWKNGLAFCALIHRHFPDLIDYDSLDGKNAQQNLELAFKVAEEKLGIPRLLDVSDMLVDRPDERSVMTQVSEYFHRFANQGVKELAAKRAQKFIAFARSMQQSQEEYEKIARALLAWIERTSSGFGEYKFGETLEDAKDAQGLLRSFIVTEKPARIAQKLDLETLFAEIQTKLKVNNRKAYAPPQGLSPDNLDEAFEALQGVEKKFGLSVRENRFRFITKQESKLSDEKLAEFKDSFNHFDSNKSGGLDRVEFKAACMTLGVPFKDDTAYENTFKETSAGGSHISLDNYISFLTKLYEDKDSPETVKASFKQLAGDKDTIQAADLAVPPLGEDDIKFLIASMPEGEGGKFDYGKFVDASYG